MSFEDKSFWMQKTGGCLQDGETPYVDSSVLEAKRPHQWSMDGTETDLFPHKKQAVEAPNLHTFSGLLNSNISPWGNDTSLQSIGSELTDRMFDSETSRTINYNERNFANMDAANNINSGSKGIEDSFGNESSFGLSISHQFEDHRSERNYGGIRKVKVNQVKDAENFMSPSTRHAYSRGDDNCMSMGLSFGIGNENVISMGDDYNRVDGNFISMGQPYNNEDNTSTIGHAYQANCELAINESFVKTDNTIPSINGTFDKDCEHNGVVSISQSFPRLDDGLLSQNFSKGSGNALLMNNCTSSELAFNNFDRGVSSMGHSFGKGNSNIISFGGFQDDEQSCERILCSYGLLTGQSSVQRSESLSDDAIVSTANMSACISEAGSKKREDKMGKKASPNSFPSNVRSLLSTGMLDGVPVKYMAWSREKELRGIIQGSGYLCSCPSCNYSKAINAYEFERHALCKTKHPNNHIYFENGKTIYGIVQELRNTPQNLLFEVIQTITGSPINQKSFRLWKESFLAATRELQRIYGKDESKQLLSGTLI